jgi:hypothetical protein
MKAFIPATLGGHSGVWQPDVRRRSITLFSASLTALLPKRFFHVPGHSVHVDSEALFQKVMLTAARRWQPSGCHQISEIPTNGRRIQTLSDNSHRRQRVTLQENTDEQMLGPNIATQTIRLAPGPPHDSTRRWAKRPTLPRYVVIDFVVDFDSHTGAFSPSKDSAAGVLLVYGLLGHPEPLSDRQPRPTLRSGVIHLDLLENVNHRSERRHGTKSHRRIIAVTRHGHLGHLDEGAFGHKSQATLTPVAKVNLR